MNYEEFCKQFNISLNEQQAQAVQHTVGAVLLLAVPGSGKTTALVARLGYMLYCVGVIPEHPHQNYEQLQGARKLRIMSSP